MPSLEAQTAMSVAMADVIGNRIFAGHDREVIAGALAELMATFLLNHKSDDRARQEEVRAEILARFCQTVRGLVAAQEVADGETIQ